MMRGSAVYSKESYTIHSSNNEFTSNSAVNLGGTLFWHYTPQAGGVRDLPNILSVSDVFDGNAAPYGTELATQGMAVHSFNTSEFLFVSDFKSNPPMQISLLDYYNSSVTGTFGGSPIEMTFNAVPSDDWAYCVTGENGQTSSGQVSGQSTITSTQAGMLPTFTAMKLTCMPGNNMSVVFTYADVSISGIEMADITTHYSTRMHILRAAFRECVAGEYYFNHECHVCPAGTYSFALNPVDYKLTVCEDAPPNVNETGTSGNSFSVNPGFWRISNQTDVPLKCPFGDTACAGGPNVLDGACNALYEGNVYAFRLLILIIMYLLV